MNHHEIEQQEIIERYVRHQLNPAERSAFQEHYFACDQCFEQTQSTARLIAGVQHAARTGVLAPGTREVAQVTPWWAGWFSPAFALAATACLVLAMALGWIVFQRIPRLQAELAQERQARAAAERQKEQNLQTTKDELEKERQRTAQEKAEREKLANQIARNETSAPALTPRVRANTETSANVPVVILESTREAKSGTNFQLPQQAKALTLWIEVEPGNRFDSYQMQIFEVGGRVRKTINGLKANSYGALAASISTQQLPPGKYLVKLFGAHQQQKELVGEYDLTLRK